MKNKQVEYFCPGLVEKLNIDMADIYFIVEPTTAAQRLFLIALAAAEKEHSALYMNICDTPFEEWLGLSAEATREMILTLAHFDFIKLTPMTENSKAYYFISTHLGVADGLAEE